jgi:hypothetical protein
MTRKQAIARANALLDERDRIWSKVTGSTTHGKGANAELEIHGVTPAEIGRVAKINSKVTGLRMRFNLWGEVRA